jgi:hypothetical protein
MELPSDEKLAAVSARFIFLKALDMAMNASDDSEMAVDGEGQGQDEGEAGNTGRVQGSLLTSMVSEAQELLQQSSMEAAAAAAAAVEAQSQSAKRGEKRDKDAPASSQAAAAAALQCPLLNSLDRRIEAAVQTIQQLLGEADALVQTVGAVAELEAQIGYVLFYTFVFMPVSVLVRY